MLVCRNSDGIQYVQCNPIICELHQLDIMSLVEPGTVWEQRRAVSVMSHSGYPVYIHRSTLDFVSTNVFIFIFNIRIYNL